MEWTADHVKSAYQLAVIPRIGHFVTDQAPELVTKLLLEHLAATR